MQIIQIFNSFPGLHSLRGVFLLGKTSGQICVLLNFSKVKKETQRLPRNRSGNMDADGEYFLRFVNTICTKMITVLTRYRPIVLELI